MVLFQMKISLQLLSDLTVVSQFKNASINHTKIRAKFKYSQKADNSPSSTMQNELERKRAALMARGLPKKKPISGVKHIVLVSSGKGGVGKSTTAVNLATALKIIDFNKNIGLLDADIFGPSIPLMMNLRDTPLLDNKNLMIPLSNYGIKCMSMGFLIAEGSPVIWRGLMVMQALEKLLYQVSWGDIDCLVIDTPPGTGDTLLSLIQNLPIAGAILVTTPQSASVQVTKRGAIMFQKLAIPIIGLIENMSSIKCPSCNKSIALFGDESIKLASEINTEILQQIPLQNEISHGADQGVPIVIAKPNNPISVMYKNLAKQVLMFLENLK